MFRYLSYYILKYSMPIIVMIGIITIFSFHYSFFSDSSLEVDFSLEQMFPENDPEKKAYDSFINEFSREDDKILIMYDDVNPTSRESIISLSKLTEALELDVNGIENVISLSNIDNGDYFSQDLTDSEWEVRVENLLNHPIYPNLIISKDGNAGAILMDLSDDVLAQEDRARIMHDIYTILNVYDWNWYEAGIPVLRTRYIEFMSSERAIFIPISFLVAGLVLLYIFRQLKLIIISLLSLGTTLIWIAGIMSYFNITVNVVSYLTFNLLMIIGASNAVHILMKYHEGLRLGLDRHNSLKRVIEKIGAALLLTSFTTAVGFFSLSMTNIKITQQFGILVGSGVMIMFILNIIIMPILLNYISIPGSSHVDRLIDNEKFKFANKLNSFNKSHPYLIILFSILIFFFSLIGLYKMNFNASVLEDLRPGNKIYDDIKYVENVFGGMLSIEVIIDTEEELGGLDPIFLKKSQILKNYILEIPEISFAISPVDYIILLNEEIGDGLRELPEDLEDVLSLVIEYEPVQALLSPDFSKYRISCRITDIPYSRGEAIRDKILSKSSSLFGSDIEVGITGSTLMALSTNRHLVKNLTQSFMIAFLIIFISIVILFRSVRLSLISILPNIIPLMIAGGLMGYLGIKLRPSTAMTFSIALGIAVDNTIHFLARFRQELREDGDYERAVSHTLLTTGKAIMSTGVILSLGFFVLYFSEFVPNHEFGLLATIIIITAVCASLILLPVLILQIKPILRFKEDFYSGTK